MTESERNLSDSDDWTLYKPIYVNHGQNIIDPSNFNPIYSLHMHPNHEHIATGGHDFKTRIWSFQPIISSFIEKDESIDKLFATLSGHNGAVNCVRYNPLGSLLATGSDDKSIIIYSTNDSYSQLYRLIDTHQEEIQDLSWYYDNSLLAAATFTSVIIWNITSSSLVHIIHIDTEYCRGVAFDPAGRYLAAQAQGVIYIYSVFDWNIALTISNSLSSKSLAGIRFVTFNRLSWSPNGELLGVPFGRDPKHSSFIAPLFPRCSEEASMCIVGHINPITVVTFAPLLFYPNVSLEKSTAFLIIAAGGSDGMLSIWTSNSKKPLMIINNFFSTAILDMTWSRNGEYLIGCSLDGSIEKVPLEFIKDLSNDIPFLSSELPLIHHSSNLPPIEVKNTESHNNSNVSPSVSSIEIKNRSDSTSLGLSRTEPQVHHLQIKRKAEKSERPMTSSPVRIKPSSTEKSEFRSFQTTRTLPPVSKEKHIPIFRPFSFSLLDDESSSHFVEITSSSSFHGMNPTILTVTSGGKQLWKNVIPFPVFYGVGNSTFIAAGSNSTVTAYRTRTGQICLPPMILQGDVQAMNCKSNGPYLLIIFSSFFSLIDVLNYDLIAEASFESFFDSLPSSHIVSSGNVILFNMNNAYLFHCRLKNWFHLTDRHFIGSPYLSSLSNDKLPPSLSALILSEKTSDINLSSLQSIPIRSHIHGLSNSNPLLTSNISAAHLESQIIFSEFIHSPSEYIKWLVTYVSFLINTSSEWSIFKLKSLCFDLISSSSIPNGIDKKRLLENIISSLASKQELHSFAVELEETLHSIDRKSVSL